MDGTNRAPAVRAHREPRPRGTETGPQGAGHAPPLVARSLAPAAVLAALLLAPFYLSDFRLGLLGKYLAFALAALGVDLLWGYAGMLALGQGVFFGLGAYAFAMYLKLEASGGELPDFMSWSGLEELPWFWAPFRHPAVAAAASILLPCLLAAMVGYPVFRSRIRGPYFAILTQALALIFSILFVGQQPYTGGTNGITNFTTVFGRPLSDPGMRRALYWATVLALAAAYVLSRRLAASRFGRLLVAVRDGENRLRFSGYDPAVIKTAVFVVAAGLAGLAGALFVPQVGIISPSMMGVVPSVEMVIWVAVGGRGTLAGAVLGAVLVNAAKTSFSESFPSAWTYFYGGLLLGTVLFVPGGILGLGRNLVRPAGRLAPPAGPATLSQDERRNAS